MEREGLKKKKNGKWKNGKHNTTLSSMAEKGSRDEGMRSRAQST
jgi:hypothetical protein